MPTNPEFGTEIEGASDDALVYDQGSVELKQFEDNVVTDIMYMLSISEDARAENGREEEWEEYSRMYNCILDGDNPYDSEVFDPEAFSAVETIYPRITNTLLGGPEIFGVKATGQEDVGRARLSKIYLDYTADRMDLYTKLGDVIKNGLIYGTGLAKVFWRKESERREVPIPLPNGQTTKMTQNVITYDDPDLEAIDLDTLFIDPAATCFENARYVIQEYNRTRQYLMQKEQEGVYFNIGQIPKAIPAGENRGNRDTRRDHKKDSYQPERISMYHENMDNVVLHEYYGLYDINQDGYLEEALITIANKATVIRVDPNPFPGGFKPYLKYCPIPQPGSFYGMSILKPIKSIQNALNARTNQIGDNIELILNRMWKVNRFADIDENQLVSAPGGIVYVNQLTDLEPVETQDIMASVFPEVQRLEAKVQKALGTWDYASGGAPARQEAATTVISLQQVAEIRFKTMILNCERQVIRPLGNMNIKMGQKFLTQARQIRVVGREAAMRYSQSEFEELQGADLVNDPDIYAVGAGVDPTISKQMQFDGIMQFLNIMGAAPQLSMNPMFGINWAGIVEELPYVLDLKLNQPLLIPYNPMIGYENVKSKEQMADQMMMNQMSLMQQSAIAAQNPGPLDEGGGEGEEGESEEEGGGETEETAGDGEESSPPPDNDEGGGDEEA